MRKARADAAALTGRDFYYRLSNNPTPQHARVWDAERFINARAKEGKESDPPYTVRMIGAAEYNEAVRSCR